MNSWPACVQGYNSFPNHVATSFCRRSSWSRRLTEPTMSDLASIQSLLCNPLRYHQTRGHLHQTAGNCKGLARPSNFEHTLCADRTGTTSDHKHCIRAKMFENYWSWMFHIVACGVVSKHRAPAMHDVRTYVRKYCARMIQFLIWRVQLPGLRRQATQITWETAPATNRMAWLSTYFHTYIRTYIIGLRTYLHTNVRTSCLRMRSYVPMHVRTYVIYYGDVIIRTQSSGKTVPLDGHTKPLCTNVRTYVIRCSGRESDMRDRQVLRIAQES